jgi:hypothetical protein
VDGDAAHLSAVNPAFIFGSAFSKIELDAGRMRL